MDACGMGANISKQRLVCEALSAMVAAYPGWHLVVTCRQCCGCIRRLRDCGNCPARTLPMAAMPPGITVRHLLDRLRCRECRARPDRVWLCWPDKLDWRRRTLCVKGRGSMA